jgi:hypothetical protein
MAKADIKKSFIITLTLDKNEAYLIKAMMQNPHPDDNTNSRRIKEDIFNALPSFGDLV